MKRRGGELFAPVLADTPPGCCVCCDEPLPPRNVKHAKKYRRKFQRLMCGDAECLQTYFVLRKSLLADLREAARSIRRANETLMERAR